MQQHISGISRILVLATAVALVVSIFVPIWRIELDAPQYPEGLMMQIYASKLGGQVEIINGLNHYIGMQTLHAENFIEFTILPYIIGAYALLMFVTGIAGRKKLLYIAFWSFVAFGVIAMVDFWRWEYNYGHNLDPNAAIIVPGMSYQPPLIGFKQLLNFGAYSVPDIGGWLFVLGGILMLIATLYESGTLSKLLSKKQRTGIAVSLCIIQFMVSCSSNQPEPIVLHKDKCDYCAMSIADGRFGAEVITTKGRIYKFDDIQCLLNYKNEKNTIEFKLYFVNDYNADNILIDATKAFYVQNEALRSPMGGNFAAFSDREIATKFSSKNQATIQTWHELMN